MLLRDLTFVGFLTSKWKDFAVFSFSWRPIAREAGIAFQVEVEDAGGSDGKELHYGNIPWDWCFIGAPEEHVHSPHERVRKHDIYAMVELYKVLMAKL